MAVPWFSGALILMGFWGLLQLQAGEAFGTFGFDIHHRYSDPVKGILDLHGLPEKGSLQYYAAMAHRDHFFRGRHLAEETPVTFAGGNETVISPALGFLHYANVSVGSPGSSYLVALDTGSDLFWLPCDCTSCVRGIETRDGRKIDFNIYSPNSSSTSNVVPCNSTLCGQRRQCSVRYKGCAYQVLYLSNNTSSTGILVEDVLHLATDDIQLKSVNAPITLGCGVVQSGAFLDGAAPNGLFGLGMDDISVPSILAKKGLAANSFSMCFGPDGIGRIVFGDKGSSDQGETPFNLRESHPTYNISLTQITVEKNISNIDVTAIFDSGTSFTTLSDPAYTIITENFNAQVKEQRRPPNSASPFEYCYNLSPNQKEFAVPDLNFTMKGGSVFSILDPIAIMSTEGGARIYCLALVKSADINIIGQNFMTGHRVVFDRERMILGWKESDCYDARDSSTLPIGRHNSTQAPSPSSMVPEATSKNTGNPPRSSPASESPPPPPSGNHAAVLSSSISNLLVVLFSFLGHYLVIVSS